MSRLRRLIMLSSALAVTATASAQSSVAPLTLDDVLASSASNFPAILQALAGRRAAEADVLSAAGAFDLVFESDGFGRASGFYDGIAADVKASQRLRPLGANVYAGYKLSRGDFPIYEDVNFTNLGGAVRVGMMFSLLRNREIDRQRFGEIDAALGLEAADLDLLLVRVGVQQRAQIAYWRWIVAGRRLQVLEELLQLASDRQAGFEKQVERGALAKISLTENQQNITRRQTLVTGAERDLAVAANDLSLYLRDASGALIVPTPEQLPQEKTLAEISTLADIDGFALSTALERRPELGLLRNAIEREKNRIALAKNNIKPQLDFGVEVQSGLGGVGEGGVSRDSTDTIIGFNFSVPLQRRVEKGRLQRSEARLDAVLEQRRLTEDQIALELRNVLLELQTARDLMFLASQEFDQADIMRVAEERRFESGAANFFLVNQREETAADARIRMFQAELATRLARANYDAATVDLERLGLDDEVIGTAP